MEEQLVYGCETISYVLVQFRMPTHLRECEPSQGSQAKKKKKTAEKTT
jgi:hypothetical protein